MHRLQIQLVVVEEVAVCVAHVGLPVLVHGKVVRCLLLEANIGVVHDLAVHNVAHLERRLVLLGRALLLQRLFNGVQFFFGRRLRDTDTFE